MPRIRPQSNNIKIKVSTQQTDDTVNVSTTNGTNPVKASNSMAEYWSNKSKEWAISENIVDNTDYSSKHYAELSKDSYDGIDELVNGFEQTVEDATTNAVQEISGAKDDAIADIIIEGGTQVNLVETTGGTLVTQMTGLKDQTLGYKNDAQSSANSASVSETNAHIYETNALSYSNSASGSASIATQKATEAASSAINASESELNALTYSNSASSSALSASTSESNASTSETNAQTYANNANTSATNAATSEDNANIWAEGSDAEVQELGGVHSSKGWAEVSSSGQVQSDYTESDNTKKSYIKNKPDLTAFVQKNGGSSTQTISLTSGTGTTALGIKSMATSSYISFSGSSGWLGSFGVTSNKRPAFYNGTGYTLAYTSEIPTNTSDLINNSGFITGIGSNDVITALGYTPASNSAFTGADGTNAGSSGLVPAPSATDNDKYLKGDGTWANVSSGSSTDVQINGTSITSNNVANILTESAYSASNKIATMSDLPADEIFVATYNTTTFNEIKTALTNGKIVLAKLDSLYYNLTFIDTSVVFQFSRVWQDICYMVQVISTNSWSSENYIYQKKSTAVTHTANTAVGSSTKPVYISSAGAATASTSTVGGSSTPVYLNAGTITSTGLSIASSRFDGQWVYSYSTLSTATSKGSHSISLSSYLPNDSYKYEVLLNVTGYNSSNTSEGYISSDIFTIPTSDSYANYCIRVNVNSRMGANRFTIPVGTGRTLTWHVTTNAFGTASVTAYGYRRLGTNS